MLHIAASRCLGLRMGPACVKCSSRLSYRYFSTVRIAYQEHAHGHTHSHSHMAPASFHTHEDSEITPDEASQNIYMLERSDSGKYTLWNKVKDFFNPHKPINQILGHSHSHSGSSSHHSHTHASAAETVELYDPAKLTSKGVRITWIGFFVNSSMAVSKLIGGVYFHSQALLADSIHSFSDLISDVLTLSTVRFTNKKPNILYPLGYGKVETFGSLLVSSILLYAGLQIGFGSFFSIIGPILPAGASEVIEYLPFHIHSHGVEGLGGSAVADSLQTADINAAWLALACIIAKEWLFRATSKVGEEMNSKVLIANAWHHRVDSLTSMVALVTISGGYFLNVYWMDSVGGLIVSMLVMKVGISGVFQSFKELIDKAMPRDDQRYMDLEDAVNVQLMKQDRNILIKELAILPSGTNMNVVLKLGVSEFNEKYESALTLDKMGKVAEALKADITTDFRNVKNVSVQFISTSEMKELPEEEQIEDDKKEKKMEAEKKDKLN
ncbi:hypothetical protein FOA43_002622 [Brettanomyces nanus]|uniref:Cation efflux protein transmembrane domain-containing protein n=1 Tax=Eeniella nana TaxID=13502 RepID=A0A875S0H1_EENNA|nr:uncharacterized protein FOA43_002622 [Brettanomyces nanus]QPG75271.1 hypothetical protein FOA43_002622 [Brettanomyces nanus]